MYTKALTKVTDPIGSILGPVRFNDMFSQLDRFVDSLWSNSNLWEAKVFEEIQPKTTLPKVNVCETIDKYEVDIAVAGFDKKDVFLEIKDNCLFIKCEHNDEVSTEEKTYLMKEISKRSFRRVLRFPKKIDVGSASCVFNNGIVSFEINKKEIKKEEDSVKITID